jgi:hypothetical protein
VAALVDVDGFVESTGADVSALSLPQVQGVLAMASDAARSYCGWRIDRGTDTFVLDGSGSPLLMLPTLRVVEVLSVTEAGSAVTGWSVSAMGALRHPTCWGSGLSSVEVIVDHGWLEVPWDVQMVVCAAGYRLLNSGFDGSVQSERVGSYSVTYATGDGGGGGLTGAERRVLDRYRLP